MCADSIGGYVDNDFWINSIGLGYHFTSQTNLQGEQNIHHQAFASYLIELPVDGLSAKAVYGFGRAHVEDIDIDSEWENSMHSVRLRLAYEFQ